MTNPTALASAPEFYSWQAQDGKIRVHLGIAAVAQMQADVQAGLKRVPKRGAEVGGVLVGSAEEIKNVLTITVHHFQSLACEYRTGPSWTLSRKDISLLESVLRELNGATEQTIVGFYRSNTREHLGLSWADLDLIEKYFPGERHTFLLIQPQLGRTASIEFSYWAGGRVCSAPNRLEIRSTLSAFAARALAPACKAVPPASATQSARPRARLAPAEAPPEAPTPHDTRQAPPLARPETPEIPPTLHGSQQAPPAEDSETAAMAPTQHDTRLAPPQARREKSEIPPTLHGSQQAPLAEDSETPGTAPTQHDTRLAPPWPRREQSEIPPTLHGSQQAPPAEDSETPAMAPTQHGTRLAPPQARREKSEILPTLHGSQQALLAEDSETSAMAPMQHGTRLAPPQARIEQSEILPALHGSQQAPPAEDSETPAMAPTQHGTRLAPPQRKPRRLSRLGYVALGILTVVILAGAVLMYQARRSGSGATALALQVERRADKLILSWNPTAPELQAAHRVTLSIRDGRDEKTVELNVKQLLEGRLYYAPATRDVKLSLELYLDHDRRVGESVYLLVDEVVKPAAATPPAVAPSPSQPRAAESPVRLKPPLSAQGASQSPAVVP